MDRPLVASVPMTQNERKLGFRFIDCVATLVDDDRPEGYGATCEPDKYGDRYPNFSHVSGMFGGSLQCRVYVEQAGLPFAEKGEAVTFWVGPKEIYEACVQALREDRCPPEYSI